MVLFGWWEIIFRGNSSCSGCRWESLLLEESQKEEKEKGEEGEKVKIEEGKWRVVNEGLLLREVFWTRKPEELHS